uniref:Uncharacterized protein n=1 Tax=Podoviridae sp. ctPr92 TaxID=2825247 RepID=A0A8S5P746_9CAUD|nr:MAG TPA: hypothetical protein [Podoviridae sp. ctPr92]
MIEGITENILKKVYGFSDMTNEELRCKFFQKLEECIDLCNNSSEILEWIKNEGVKDNVNEILNTWKDEGTLKEILNNYILTDLKNKIISELNISLKSFSNLPLVIEENGIIEPKSSKSFTVLLSENIPQTSIVNIYFSETIENGIVYDYRIVNENTLSIRFTNVTDNSITLTDKEISLKAIY